MQINRLFEIIYILLNKKSVTSKELAQCFEVSTRTIYRDIDILSTAGIPVYTTKGKGGGICLLPDFILNKTILTEKEKTDILTSLKALKTVDFSNSHTALQKLSNLFGESQGDWIEIDFSTWYNVQAEEKFFYEIKSAILEKKVISFLYTSSKGQGIRETEPLKLCFKNSAWYLYGYCRLRNDNRLFKLRRMQNMSVLDEFFQRQAPAQIFDRNHSTFTEEYITLKLKLCPQVAHRVYDEFEQYEQQPDGNFIAEIKLPKGEWIFYYVSTFGSYCEVLEPEYIREKVKIELEKMLKYYL